MSNNLKMLKFDLKQDFCLTVFDKAKLQDLALLLILTRVAKNLHPNYISETRFEKIWGVKKGDTFCKLYPFLNPPFPLPIYVNIILDVYGSVHHEHTANTQFAEMYYI